MSEVYRRWDYNVFVKCKSERGEIEIEVVTDKSQ